jgi:hypothetical protein
VKKKDVYTCTEQYPGASQNILNYFSLLWGKPISWQCVGDIPNERRKWENETCESFSEQQMCMTNFVDKHWYVFCSKRLYYSKDESAYCVR